jgi:hypothetical protein
LGINASKSEEEDVLKKFNISKSVNGGTATTVYTEDLTGSEGDNFSFDFIETVERHLVKLINTRLQSQIVMA